MSKLDIQPKTDAHLTGEEIGTMILYLSGAIIYFGLAVTLVLTGNTNAEYAGICLFVLSGAVIGTIFAVLGAMHLGEIIATRRNRD